MDKGSWKDDVHVFEYEGKEILYQVHTGIFFQIDGLVSEILACVGVNTRADLVARLSDRYGLDEIVGAIEELEAMDILSFDPRPATEDLVDASDRGSRMPLPITMCLHVSHACNIKCSYCFAEGGNYAKLFP